MLKNRTLFFGDNLKVLREKFPKNEEGYFDLIYLDPPFNSNKDYNVLYKEGLEDSPAQLHAFEDTWHWTKETQEQFDDLVQNKDYPQKVSDLMQGLEKLIGHNDMMAYLTMMTVRLVELYRVLKSTGSIFLHCDPTASHYLKLVMDAVFGIQHFRNEIIWCYESGGRAKHFFSQKHDVILWYTISNKFTFNADAIGIPKNICENCGSELKKWNNMKKEVDEDGRVFRSIKSNGKIYKYYDDEPKTPPDYWIDIPHLQQKDPERLGYPTQKPTALLSRIIEAGTNEGDWILDPFGGCGTTAAASETLNRNWNIIDITTLSINLVKRRIEDMFPDKKMDMNVEGYPADLQGARALFKHDPFEFEYWCCDLINARPAGNKAQGKMKGADRGIDGVITFPDKDAPDAPIMHYRKLLVQVKGGHVGATQVRDLRGTLEREKAAGGIFISLEEPTKPMQKDSVEAGNYTYNMTGQKYPVIQLLTVKELLDGKRPEHPSAMGYAKKAEKINEDGTIAMF